MIFRDAELADLYGIVALLADDVLGRQREKLSDPLPEGYIDAFRALQEQAGNHLIVGIDDDGEVKACLQITMVPGIARLGAKRATIEGVRVSADHRNAGLGQRLFEHAIDLARKADCQLVQLTTDKTRPDAARFYERLGFTATHEGMKLVLD
ncbi:MAG: GNAT family N-acetyltransferase [Henriciella sp.]